MRDLLTVEDLADRYSTSVAAVHMWRHRGECPPAFKIGKRLMFRLSDVVAWENASAAEQARADQCTPATTRPNNGPTPSTGSNPESRTA